MADILSLEDEEGRRCVDILAGPDGAFGFKEFRRDPEDGGGWTLVADYTMLRHRTREDAVRARGRDRGLALHRSPPRRASRKQGLA